MGFLDFLKPKKKVAGDIAYFNLTDWWSTDFSEQERQHIINTYKPMGAPDSLTVGEYISTTMTAVGLLSGMVGWFKAKDDFDIVKKIIKKAELLIDKDTDVLDIHFLYQAKIQTFYKQRDISNNLEKAIKACEQQIAISDKAKKVFIKEYNDSLPTHVGYKQLAIIREKQKDFQKAIDISKQALFQGWTGDWDKRIERCAKKIK